MTKNSFPNNCNNYTNFRIICQPGEEKNLYG